MIHERFDVDQQFLSNDFIRTPNPRPKYSQSAEIARQTAQFLNLGGFIDQQPIRINATPPLLNNAARDNEERTKARRISSAKRATELNRVSTKLWAKSAAEHCGIDEKEFRRLCDRGDGPPYISTERGNKKKYEITALDAWNRARQK